MTFQLLNLAFLEINSNLTSISGEQWKSNRMFRRIVAFNATRDAIEHSCAGISCSGSRRVIIKQIGPAIDCRMFLANPKEIARFIPKHSIPQHKMKDFVTLFCDSIIKISTMFAIYDSFNYWDDEFDEFKNHHIRKILSSLSKREKSVQRALIQLLMFQSTDFTFNKGNIQNKLLRMFREDSWHTMILLNKNRSRSNKNFRKNKKRSRFVTYNRFLSNMMDLGYIREIKYDHNKIILHTKYIDIVNNFSKMKQEYVRCVLRSIVDENTLRSRYKKNKFDKYSKYDKSQRDRIECRAQRWVIKYLFKHKDLLENGDCGTNIIEQLLPNFTNDHNVIQAIGLTNAEFLQRMIGCGYIDVKMYDNIRKDAIYILNKSIVQELNLNPEYSLTYIQRQNICSPYNDHNKNKSNKKNNYKTKVFYKFVKFFTRGFVVRFWTIILCFVVCFY